MKDLLKAIGPFQFTIPDWVTDDTVVGSVVGAKVYAGEVRRLNKAVHAHTNEVLDSEIIALTKAGHRINAIKRRREVTHEGLKEAKDYCDDLCVKNGILVRMIRPQDDTEITVYPDQVDIIKRRGW